MCCAVWSSGLSTGRTVCQWAPASVVRATPVGNALSAGAGTWPGRTVEVGAKRTVAFGVTPMGAESVVTPAAVRHGTGAPVGCGARALPPELCATAGRVGRQPGPGELAVAAPGSERNAAPVRTARQTGLAVRYPMPTPGAEWKHRARGVSNGNRYAASW